MRARRRRLLGALALAGLGAAATGSASAQAAIVIRAGRLVDVEQGVVLADRRIVIRGERIVAILSPGEPSPAGALTIDLSAGTVYPGLIDLHTHLIGDIQSADPLAPLHTTAAADFRLGAEHARATLLAGFTTVRDVGTYRAGLDVALRDAIARDSIPGPRMSVAGAYVTRLGGGGEVTGDTTVAVPAEMRMGVVRSPTEVRARVAAILDLGADFIKVIATGAVLTVGTEPGEPELTEAEIRAAVEVAAARGTYVTAHAHGERGIENAVRAGVRAIEHGSLLDDTGIALMKAHGTWLVADIYNGDYIEEQGRRDGWPAETLRKNEETTAAQRRAFGRAARAGVKIAYGTDAGVYPHGLNARQLPYLVRYGLSPMEALQAATIDAARLMGWDDRVGSIRPGKLADLIAVEGGEWSRLERLSRVAFVMQGGRVVKDSASRRR